MKKISFIALLIITLYSCGTHGHIAESIDKSNGKIKVAISCHLSHKYYNICGTEKNDVVYISSKKMKNKENLMVEKYFQCYDTVKSFALRKGDHSFHRKATKDTITVKIVKTRFDNRNP